MKKQEKDYLSHIKDRNRDVSIDVIRGMAILIVMLGHSIQANLDLGESSLLWSRIILSFQMELMFFISGYTAIYSFPYKHTAVESLKNKSLRLLIPYLVWVIVHFLLAWMLHTAYRDFSINEFIKEFFVSDFWFLRYLYVFYILFILSDVLFGWLIKLLPQMMHSENKKNFVYVGCLSCMSLPIIAFSISGGGITATLYYVWMILGYLVASMVKNPFVVALIKSKILFLLGVTGLFITVVVALLTKLPCKILSVLFIVTLFVIFKTRYTIWNKNKVSDILSNIGKNTLPFYAIHWCILFSPLWRIQLYTTIFANWPTWLSVLTTLVIWLAISGTLVWILSRAKMARLLFLGNGNNEMSSKIER